MERHGIGVRYDARTLKGRGIDRDPGVHVGPKAYALAEKRHDFKSNDLARKEQNGQQILFYSEFDEGSRVAHNQRIAEANRERALLEELQREPGMQGKDGRTLDKFAASGQEEKSLCGSRTEHLAPLI
jgi:hypothetical protein